MASAELTGASPTPSAPEPQTQQASARPSPGRHAAETGPGILLELGFDDDNLYGVRATVAAHVSTVAGDRTVDTVVLIAHELASNAVRHGGGSGRLRLWLADDDLYCEVSDEGGGLADVALAGHSRPAPSLPGGRGLWIARQLSEVHIDSSPAGTTVTAVVPLQG